MSRCLYCLDLAKKKALDCHKLIRVAQLTISDLQMSFAPNKCSKSKCCVLQ